MERISYIENVLGGNFRVVLISCARELYGQCLTQTVRLCSDPEGFVQSSFSKIVCRKAVCVYSYICVHAHLHIHICIHTHEIVKQETRFYSAVLLKN